MINKLDPAAATPKNGFNNKVLTCTGQNILQQRHFI